MFYGQYELDRIIFERFFKDKVGGFFVECGAFDGISESSCKFFEESMNWKGINIEPVPYAFNKLKNNRLNCINLNYALSSTSDKKTFTNAIHPSLGLNFGNGSLNHKEHHKNELIGMGCKFETFEVECVRFENIWKQHGTPDIDLFVLDVEGHEIEALDGILSISYQSLPKVFCIEDTIADKNKLNDMLLPLYNYHSNYAHNSFYIKK